MGDPSQSRRREYHLPTLSPCCPTDLRILFPISLTGSFYCMPYRLMYKIPITPCLQGLETWMDQMWTRQEALSSRFDFLAGVDGLTAIHLKKQWLSQRIYTGRVLGEPGRGETTQARPVVFPPTRRSGCWRSSDVWVDATNCSPVSPQHFLSLHLDISHLPVGSDHYSSAHAAMVSLGID